MAITPILLVGEIYVDFTLATQNASVKLRLGGIVHAARGLWAAGVPYAVAAVCPAYLETEAKKYLEQHGCAEFTLIAAVDGAPNVITIGDVREVGPQGYVDLLRNTKKILNIDHSADLRKFQDVILFPGAYDLTLVSKKLSETAGVVVDIAYDIQNVEQLNSLSNRITDIVISTSSELFLRFGSDDVNSLLDLFKPFADFLLLKENRGGSRLFDLRAGTLDHVPANLGETVNSVGVGDVFTAVYASFLKSDRSAASWRGMQVATRYAQTTYVDDFKTNVQRDFKLEIDEVRSLGGVSLPWHQRKKYEIYLAAPDFSYVDKKEVDAAVEALKYHNFLVHRPILENGEAKLGSTTSELSDFFFKDLESLRRCAIIFAVPLSRDPGTLVEMGVGIAENKPVITYDPRGESNNTMVVCGSYHYSDDLDASLNALFECCSRLMAGRSL